MFHFIVHLKQQTRVTYTHVWRVVTSNHGVPMELLRYYKVLNKRRQLSGMGIFKYHYHLMEYYKTFMVISSNTLFGTTFANCWIKLSKFTSATKWKLLKICHLRHRLRIFFFMMSISTWDKIHFWIYLLNRNSLSHQTWPVDRYKQGQ